MTKAGIYVHIPYCKSKCAYCSFVSSSDCASMPLYVDALVKEIKARSGGAADTIYLGGGTPSVLYRGALNKILTALQDCFDVDKDAEITVECNPDSAVPAFFEECALSGVNRISIGLQTQRDDLLARVGRPHGFAQFLQAVDAAKKAGFANISADVILGLPEQTLEDALGAVDALAPLNLTHVSVYGLAVEENTPLYESGFLCDEDLCADMYGACVERLAAAGFMRYEVSNFAKAGYESRHNLKYWTGAPYIGLGVAAHSFDGNVRIANTANTAKYIVGNRVAERMELSRQDKIEEMIMLSLRTSSGLDLKAFQRRFGEDLAQSKREQIDRLTKLRLVEVAGDRLMLTPDAYYLMNEVIVSLL